MLTSDALFETKSRLLTRRGTTRDLFDIWYFVAHVGKTLEEVFAFAQDENSFYTDELIKKRLLPLRQHDLDPGFDSLLDHGPKNFDELVRAIQTLVNDYEVREAERLAADAFASSNP